MKKIFILALSSVFTISPFISHAATADTDSNTSRNPANDIASGDIQKSPATAEPAESPLTGTFAITSNYLFRGISVSDNLPAVQGGLTYTFLKPGIYFNVWGSNTNFAAPDGSTATVEFDTVAGVANDLGEHFHYDLSIARYNYPKASAASYNEFIANAAYYFVTAQIGFSSDVYGSHQDGTYYNLGINFDVPPQYALHFNNVNIKGGIGHYSLPRSAGLLSYNDYNIQISKAIGIYTLALQWTGTNGNNQTPPIDDDHIVAAVTARF